MTKARISTLRSLLRSTSTPTSPLWRQNPAQRCLNLGRLISWYCLMPDEIVVPLLIPSK